MKSCWNRLEVEKSSPFGLTVLKRSDMSLVCVWTIGLNVTCTLSRPLNPTFLATAKVQRSALAFKQEGNLNLKECNAINVVYIE